MIERILFPTISTIFSHRLFSHFDFTGHFNCILDEFNQDWSKIWNFFNNLIFECSICF